MLARKHVLRKHAAGLRLEFVQARRLFVVLVSTARLRTPLMSSALLCLLLVISLRARIRGCSRYLLDAFGNGLSAPLIA